MYEGCPLAVNIRLLRPLAFLVLVLGLGRGAALVAADADWNQWRGPNRDGLAPHSPPLLEKLPDAGLKPVWIVKGELPAATSGGWSSPVVVEGRVYLFTHKRTRVGQDQLPPRKYPYLPPEQRGGMSDAEYEQYERNRRDEDQQRAANFRFDEITYCLDARNGKPIWTNERLSVYTRFAQSGSPAVVDGRLYVLGAGRAARCLDAATGEDLWQTPLPGTFRDEYQQSSFAVADGVAAVACGPLFGLDARSGRLRWQTAESDASAEHSSPVVWQDGGRISLIANLGGGETVCVEPVSGNERWRIRSEAGHSTPIIAGSRLITYGSSRKKGLRCFTMDEQPPRLLWTYNGLSDPGSSPVVVEGHVYVQGGRRLACVDIGTGRAAWTATLQLGNPRYTSLVAADNKIIYAFDGVLAFAADPSGYQPQIDAKIDADGLMAGEAAFRQLWQLDELERTAEGQRESERLWRKAFDHAGPLPCSSPALSDGRLYIRLQRGLACYDLRRL